MQIDRARFLLLTATLAGGGGCSSNPPEGPNTPTSAVPTTSDAAVDTPPEDTTDPVATGPSTDTTGQTTATPTPTQPAGACDNDTGTPANCAISGPPGPFCEGLSDAKAYCKGYKNALRGAIATKAVACLNAASGKPAICDYDASESCATDAIRTACIQPSTFNACSPVVSTCSGSSWSKLTMQDCQALLSAVKDGKRQAMITCMSEGCSLESCTWMLR